MESGFCYRRFLFVCVWLGGLSIAAQAATWRVNQEGLGDFLTIQAAVDVAAAGDSIVLDPGVYRGPGNSDIDLSGKAIAIGSLDPLDPNIVETTVIDCAGTVLEPHRAFYIVGANDVEIWGLTITNGLSWAGGAILCNNSALELNHCRLIGNAAMSGPSEADPNGGPGGALYCEGSHVIVTACLISNNAAGNGAESREGRGGIGGSGGGICCVRSELTVTGSAIRNNAAGAGGSSDTGVAGEGGSGGGIYGGLVALTDSTISWNRAGDGGQGLRSGRGGRGGGVQADAAVVNRCIIEANRAGAGGKAGSGAGDPNLASGGRGGDGGGVYTDTLDMTSSLVVGNRAGRAYAAGTDGFIVNGDGGGLWCVTGVARHCTIAGNMVHWRNMVTDSRIELAPGLGAGVFCTPDTIITHSILQENVPAEMIGPDCNNVMYSNVAEGTCPVGGTNSSAAPLFVRSGSWVDVNDPNAVVEADDPNAVWVPGDYHLTALSPCIDAGDPNYFADPNETDLDGRPRVADAAIDIGAYEFRSLVPVYRFWSVHTGKHFYTIDEAEKTKCLTEYADFWTFEGIVYYAYVRDIEPNLMPVYRFWSDQLGGHFYTISEAERDKVIAKHSDVWTFEGVAFYAWPEGQQPAGTKPVYRFWSNRLAGHFYTIKEAEKDKLINEFSYTWIYEGPAWYAWAEPPVAESPVEKPAAPDPIAYEFAGGSENALYAIRLKAAVDGKEVKIDLADIALVPTAARLNAVIDLGSRKATLYEFHLEAALAEHSATIGGGDTGVDIPFVVQAQGLFAATAPRGPYDIDPQNLSFPAVGIEDVAGENEKFTLTGAVTIDGQRSAIELTVGATRFEIDAKAVLDASGLPDRLDANLADVFQWSRTDQEDLLLETIVKDHTVQLYLTYARVQTNGVWQGRRTPGPGE